MTGAVRILFRRDIHDTLAQGEAIMTRGVRTIIIPVKDLAQAKTVYGTLLGADADGNVIGLLQAP